MNIETFDVSKYNDLLGRGLCCGVGAEGGQVCIEAAVSLVLGEGLDDKPTCVASAVRHFAVRLNDSRWSSAQARAKGLRDLGLAQLGSVGFVDDVAFAKRLAELHIRELLPAFLREVVPGTADLEAAAKRCEEEGSADAADAAARSAADAAADRCLLMSAGIAVRVLREMGSPGVKLLDQEAA